MLWSGDRRRRPQELSLVEDQDGLGPNAVMLHRIGCRLGLHELLKRGHVRDVRDQADTIRALGVMEGTNRDAQGPEHLLSPRRAQPVLNGVDLMEYEMCCHALFLLRQTACLLASNPPSLGRGVDGGPEVEALLGRREDVIDVISSPSRTCSPPASEPRLTVRSGSFVELDAQRAGVHTGIRHRLAQLRIFHEGVRLL